MKSSLDTKIVWDKLAADPAFSTGVPEAAMEAFHAVVDALPEVLKDQLGATVALDTLIQAKLDIVEHMLESGAIGKVAAAAVAAIPEEMRPDPAEMVEMLSGAMKQLRAPFMEMIHNGAEFLRENGLTERAFMAHPKGAGLNAESLAAYDAGTLTVAGLLLNQPAVLLANGG